MRKVTANATAHLLQAMASGRAVTIRYVKPDGEVSRRAIEIHSLRVTLNGDLIVRAWDRRDREMTTFRVDRITHYTLHRAPKLASYQLPVVADVETLVDEDTNEVTGFRAWDEALTLAA